MDTTPSAKRTSIDDNGPLSKKIKGSPEIPAQYSDAVRKKLAATSRTGQACDRCKERKMKCDTDPIACQPCRQKSLRCFTTDRVTGQARERGQSDRADSEIGYLRDQVAAYRRKYGSLHQDNLDSPLQPRPTNGIPLPATDKSNKHLPSTRYTGWSTIEIAEGLPSNVITGTKVDVLDGVIDVGDFPCEYMEDYDGTVLDRFNLSPTSIFNTVCGRQRVQSENLPASKESALRECRYFSLVVSLYVPVVHGPSLEALIHKLYDKPSSIRLAEKIQVIMILAVMAHQQATRNQDKVVEKLQEAINYLHYALSFYTELIEDGSLAAIQALTVMVIYFRVLPKPGLSWRFANQVLFRAIELNYHRDPDKITLPAAEDNILAKEIRKRIFHIILGIAITTSCRLNLPGIAPLRSCDCPLPLLVQDHEISDQGLAQERSGSCDYYPSIHLSRLLPLLIELQEHIVTRRNSPAEYVDIIEILSSKINAWRQEWDDMIKADRQQVSLKVATLQIEQWAAEYMLILYHPVSCPPTLTDVLERNLDFCHRSARKLLQTFHTLCSKYKGVDFTWHSTAVYAAALGLTIYIYKRRKPQSPEALDAMKNEFNGWLQLVAYADVFLRTGNYLQGIFQPRIRALEDEYGVSSTAQSAQANNTSRSNSFAPSSGTPTIFPFKTDANAAVTPLPQAHTPHVKAEESPMPHMNHVHTFPPGHTSTPAPQWLPSLQYLPSATTPTASSPVYPGFSQTTPQYPMISTSLAPILNPVTQSWPSNNTTLTPTTTEAVLAFSPIQCFAGTEYVWPFASLPEGYQANT